MRPEPEAHSFLWTDRFQGTRRFQILLENLITMTCYPMGIITF